MTVGALTRFRVGQVLLGWPTRDMREREESCIEWSPSLLHPEWNALRYGELAALRCPFFTVLCDIHSLPALFSRDTVISATRHLFAQLFASS